MGDEKCKDYKKYKIPLISGIVIVIFIIAGILTLSVHMQVLGSKKGILKELFYVKDTSLYCASLKNLKKEPKKVTNDVLNMDQKVISKDGKYFVG